MNLTSRSRYALKIMIDLAVHGAAEYVVHRRDIASRQGIPADYLDQIMILLRRADLVKSVRGRGGGYQLARSATEISLWDLFSAVENTLEPVQCLSADDPCSFDISCASHDAWRQIYVAIQRPLQAMSLAQVMDSSTLKHQFCPAAGLRECRGKSTRTLANSTLGEVKYV